MRLGKTISTAVAVAASVLGFTGWQVARAGGQGSSNNTPAGQGPNGENGSTLQIYSRLTELDVTVTDGKGRPIKGLKASDFTVADNGKPQPIRSFQEFSSAATEAEPVLPNLPPDVYTNVQPPSASGAVNILLLDALNTDPMDQVFIKQESIHYLKGMPKGTRVAVLGLSDRLRVLQGFTSDPAILEAAVKSKRNRSMPSPFIDTDSGAAMDAQMDIDSDSTITNDGTVASLAEFENEQATYMQDLRNRMTLEALNQIAAYVASVKGRKNLIWFTSGMPLNIFPSGGRNDLGGMTDYAKDLRKTTDLLTAAEVAVYPVDARGLFSNPADSVANNDRPKITSKTGATKAAANLAFQRKTGQELLSMEAVAEATGGVAYYNTNDLKQAVAKAIENGANYYTISYVPPSPAYDGRYHDINVKVDRPGVKLSYRRGYNADDIADNAISPGISLATAAPEPYGTNMAASMQRGAPTSSQLLFAMRVDSIAEETATKVLGSLDPRLQGKALRRYEFEFSMPGSQISFTNTPDGMRKASLEFDIVAYDVYGKRITSLNQTINLPLTADRYKLLQRSPFRVIQQIDLPAGELFVRTGILDEVSDKVGTLEIPLTVAKITAGGIGGKVATRPSSP